MRYRSVPNKDLFADLDNLKESSLLRDIDGTNIGVLQNDTLLPFP